MNNSTNPLIIQNQDWEMFCKYISFLNEASDYIGSGYNMDMKYAAEELIARNAHHSTPEDFHTFIEEDLTKMLMSSKIMNGDGYFRESLYKQDKEEWDDDEN